MREVKKKKIIINACQPCVNTVLLTSEQISNAVDTPLALLEYKGIHPKTRDLAMKPSIRGCCSHELGRDVIEVVLQRVVLDMAQAKDPHLNEVFAVYGKAKLVTNEAFVLYYGKAKLIHERLRSSMKDIS